MIFLTCDKKYISYLSLFSLISKHIKVLNHVCDQSATQSFNFRLKNFRFWSFLLFLSISVLIYLLICFRKHGSPVEWSQNDRRLNYHGCTTGLIAIRIAAGTNVYPSFQKYFDGLLKKSSTKICGINFNYFLSVPFFLNELSDELTRK